MIDVLVKFKEIYETKDKNFIYYTLNTSVFEEIMLWVSQFTGNDSSEEVEVTDNEKTDEI